jgi:hypothetical protein
MQVANLVIAIPETGQSFECDSDWTIGDTEVGIRKDHYRDGSIKLKKTSTGKEISTREAKSLAEEIRRMTGEGIETLQFVGDKIISQGRERESIHFCSWRENFNPTKLKVLLQVSQ